MEIEHGIDMAMEMVMANGIGMGMVMMKWIDMEMEIVSGIDMVMVMVTGIGMVLVNGIGIGMEMVMAMILHVLIIGMSLKSAFLATFTHRGKGDVSTAYPQDAVLHIFERVFLEHNRI